MAVATAELLQLGRRAEAHARALSEALRAAEKERKTKRWERAAAVVLRTMFAKQEAIYLDLIVQALRQAQLAEADTPDLPIDWERLMADVALGSAPAAVQNLTPALLSATEQGGKDVMSELGVSYGFNVPNALAYTAARLYAANLVTRVNTTTRERLQATVEDGMRAGKGVQGISADIRKLGKAFRVPKPQKHIRDRADLIAATELAFAYERGGWAANQQLQRAGYVLEKRVLAVNDARTDQLCAGYARQGWVKDDVVYGRNSLHPPFHPACRCALTYREPPGQQLAPWAPSMTEAAARKWAKGSAVPGTWSHHTSAEAAKAIATGGFKTSGGMYGQGVYLTADTSAAAINRAHTDTRLETVVKADKVATITEVGFTGVRKWMDKNALPGEDDPSVTAARLKIDALRIKHPTAESGEWVVVFDPKRVTVISQP